MGTLLSDLRYSLQELRKHPGFTLTAVLSLALGIGATSAVFSVIYGVLIEPYPYSGADRIMELFVNNKFGKNIAVFNGPQLRQLRQTNSFENLVALETRLPVVTGGDLPESVRAECFAGSAANYFGVPALMGRWLISSDAPEGEEPSRVVVLTHQFWQRHYGGDPGVVGRTLQLDHQNYQVVGVMPPRFRWGGSTDVYLPLKVTGDPDVYFRTTFKLRSGVTAARADAELQPLLDQFARQSPKRYPDHFRVDLTGIIDLWARPLGPLLYLLLGAVGLLLLIGCANVSILLLARGTQRQHELAVRAALGANRKRIVRQLLTESLAIAIAGGALSLLFAWKGLALITAWLPEGSFPGESTITMNLPVLLFSVALAFLTVLVFGISPAMQLSRPDIAQLMQNSMRRVMGTAHGRRTHNILVTSQVALTLVLLAIAAAAGRGFLRLLNADLGFDPRNTMAVQIPVHQGAHVSWPDRAEYFEQLRARIASLPEVESAAIAPNSTPPNAGFNLNMEMKGSILTETPPVRLNLVSPEYFPVLHIPVLEGRVWNPVENRQGAPRAVISAALARRYFPNGGAIGRSIGFPGFFRSQAPSAPTAPGSDGWFEITGVVGDVTNGGLLNPVIPAVYVPSTARLFMFTQILVHTRVPPLTLVRAVRAQMAQVDPEQPAMQVRDLNGWITAQREYAQQRLVAGLFGIFSLLALVLAAAGLYSVVSYSVANRTNEFGVRMALGAKRADVIRTVMASTAANVGRGVVAGMVLNIALGRIEAKWVTESPRDPLLLVGVSLFLILAASLACFVPARRAASVDPMVALRYE